MAAPSPQPKKLPPLPHLPERPGSIESIAELEEPVSANTADEALVGLLVGGLLLGNVLFDRGTGAVVGIDDDGSGPNTAPDGESSMPHYKVLVRFDDGGSMTLDYLGDVPFDRGDRVVLTDHGLVRSCAPCDS